MYINRKLTNSLNNLNEPRYFYLRDNNNLEVDLIDCSDSANIKLCEIKSSGVYNLRYRINLDKYSKVENSNFSKYLIYAGENNFNDNDLQICNVDNWLLNICH